MFFEAGKYWCCEFGCCCRTLRTSHEVADSGSFGEPENEVFFVFLLLLLLMC